MELKSAGTWRYGYGNWTNRLTITRESIEPIIDQFDTSLKGKTLKILTALVNILRN